MRQRPSTRFATVTTLQVNLTSMSLQILMSKERKVRVCLSLWRQLAKCQSRLKRNGRVLRSSDQKMPKRKRVIYRYRHLSQWKVQAAISKCGHQDRLTVKSHRPCQLIESNSSCQLPFRGIASALGTSRRTILTTSSRVSSRIRWKVPMRKFTIRC